jgi:RNA polymerase sigma-70 factor, ECF subfamily
MAVADNVLSLKDPVLFEKYFKEKYRLFCLHAFKYVQNTVTAEEIVQDLFVKLWEKRDELVIQGSITAYINIALKNTCFNYLKHQKIVVNYQQSYVMQNDADSQIDNEEHSFELEGHILEAIEQLPPKRKEIFLLSRVEGMKYQEIASTLGISVKTVEAQMGSALKQLRVLLKDYITVLLVLIAMLF